MTVSAAQVTPGEQSVGSLHVTTIDLTLATNDYASGGISIASYVPGTIVGAVTIGQKTAGGVGYLPVYDVTTEKIVLFKDEATAADAPFTEVANGSSTAVVLRLAIYWI